MADKNTSDIEKEMVRDLQLINNYAAMYAAERLQFLLYKAWDDLMHQFYSKFPPEVYRRHGVSYKTGSDGRRITNNEGWNLYQAMDKLNKNVEQGFGSHSGGITLSTADMLGRNYDLSKILGSEETAKEIIFKQIFEKGIRFPQTSRTPELSFTVMYDGIAGTPEVVLNQLKDKYIDKFLEDGYNEAGKNVKTKHIKFT